MSIMVATGRGATEAVLFRDAAAIENFRKVDTLIVDKTGTVTEGGPAFEQAIPAGDADADEVLRLAASLDQGSEHPLADAIVNAAREQGLSLSAVNDFESGSGIGVRGRVDEKRLALGNTALLDQENIDVTTMDGDAELFRQKGESVMHFADHGHLEDLVALSYQVQKSTADD